MFIGAGSTLKAGVKAAVPVPAASYSVSPITDTVDEGSYTIYIVETAGVPDGTVLYWSIQHGYTSNLDFVDVGGSFTIVNGESYFTVQPVNDNLTEGSEDFYVAVRTESSSGTIVATSSAFPTTINDTSTTPYVFNTAHTLNPGWSNDMYGSDTVLLQDSAPTTPTPQVGWTITDGVNTRTIVSSGFGVTHTTSGYGPLWILQLDSAVDFNSAATLTLTN